MLKEIKAILVCKNKGQFTNKETGQVFDYQNILIGHKEVENGEVLKVSVPKDIDIQRLVLHKEYLFTIDIPTIFNERIKIKLVSIKGE